MLLNLPGLLLVLLLLSPLASGCALNKPVTFLDNGDGIIKVNSSPLMWQKERSPQFSSLSEAENYVKELRLGGYDDWRLPTAGDFLDFYFVFDYGQAKAADYDIDIEGNYWSISEDGTGFIGAWNDDSVMCEISRTFQPGSKGYVRAVRP